MNRPHIFKGETGKIESEKNQIMRQVVDMEDKASTKKKLLRAGIKLFAEYGYAATSTRMIAAEAGVNLSAISFHFTNKTPFYYVCDKKLVSLNPSQFSFCTHSRFSKYIVVLVYSF